MKMAVKYILQIIPLLFAVSPEGRLLLRIFAESERQDKAQDYVDRFKKFIGV